MIEPERLPVGWESMQARRVLTKLSRSPVPRGEVITAYRDGVVTRRSQRREEGYTFSGGEAGYQGVEAGDLVFHALDGFAGAVGVSDSRGNSSPVYHVCAPRSGGNSGFFAYVLRAMGLTGYLATQAPNVRQRSVDFRNWESFARMLLPVPPIQEQRRIVDFLDAETARIDQMSIMRTEQYALLQAREGSVLEESVDVGSDESIKVRYLVERLTSGPRGWGDLVADSGTAFIRITNIPRRGITLSLEDLVYVDTQNGAERERTRTREGDVLVSITADIGSVAVVDGRAVDGNVSQHVALLRPISERCHPRWLAYAIKAPRAHQALTTSGYGGTKVGLGLANIADLSLPRLDYSQQAAAAARLDRDFDHMLRLRGMLQTQIDLLQERREALITAAVTGQLDVTTSRT